MHIFDAFNANQYKHVSGDFSGTLTVEAADNDGNPTSLTLPICLTVEEQPVIATTQADAPVQEEEKIPYLTYGLAGGCALLLIICIVQGTVLRKKIRKLEEDRL